MQGLRDKVKVTTTTSTISPSRLSCQTSVTLALHRLPALRLRATSAKLLLRIVEAADHDLALDRLGYGQPASTPVAS